MTLIVRKTKQEWAARAMRGAITRAENHMASGDMDAALVALAKGSKTAKSWMTGTHPQFNTHVKLRTTRVLRRRPFTVGGVEMTGYQIRSAWTALEDSAGSFVRPVLIAIDSPLADVDYVELAKSHPDYEPGAQGVKKTLITILKTTYFAGRSAAA